MRLFRRRSHEERSAKSATPTWSLFRPLSSWEVGNTQLLGIPAVGRCLDLIAGDIARVPVEIQARAGASFVEVDSAMADIFRDGPSDLLGGNAWRQKIARDLLIQGAHLDVIARTPDGRVASLTPAEFGTWGYFWDPERQTLTYQAFGQTFLPQDVLHFRRAERILFQGQGILKQFSTALAMIAAQYEAGRRVFETALPKCILEADEPLPPESVERLQQAFRSTHADASTWSTPIVVSGGMKVSEVSQRLDQSQWAAAQEFGVADVARCFSVPPSLVDSSNSPTAEDMSAYLEGCLRPLMAAIGDEVKLKTLAPGERMQFRTEQLTRGTASQQAASIRQLIDAGIVSPNEGRAMIGLPASDQDGMDDVFISKNYATVTNETESTTTAPAADDVGVDADA